MAASSSPYDLRADAMLRRPQVLLLLNVSRSTLYRMIQEGEFPAPVVLTPRIRAWPASVVHAWLKAKRDKAESATASSSPHPTGDSHE